jgi:oligopeptide/dipeptide ABC transporter ATP-binding protein
VSILRHFCPEVQVEPNTETDQRPILEVRDLKTYFETERGVIRAVDGVSFTVARAKIIGVVGESGSGKTVLSRSIMGLLPRQGTIRSGEVIFDGRNISDLSEHEMRALRGLQISMVFQDSLSSLNPVVKVGRQITEVLEFHWGIKTSEARPKALELLRAVEVPDPERRLREYPHQLSGGMRQRVAIAMALACGPKLLLADEPTTALDVTVQAHVLDLLQDLQEKNGMAMILVTHDLGVVAGRADEIIVMYAGRVVERAPTRALFRDMQMPYTEALLRSVPQMDGPPHSTFVTIGGRPPDLSNPPPGCRFSPRCSRAQERCHTEEPPLMPGPTAGHWFACWFPLGGQPVDTSAAALPASAAGEPNGAG